MMPSARPVPCASPAAPPSPCVKCRKVPEHSPAGKRDRHKACSALTGALIAELFQALQRLFKFEAGHQILQIAEQFSGQQALQLIGMG